jgi:3-oxo-5alpha-steroid 4-dehydrogenase
MSWDYEVDVVIVGYGGAGVCAAIEAANAGAEVLVLECTGGYGGSTSMSAGYLYLGGGTALQRACGVEDDPDTMFRFLMEATGPGPDEAKLRVYCDEGPAHYDWLVDQGIPFKASVYAGEPTWEILTDDGLTYSGGENAWPFNEIATPAPRAHVPQLEGKVQGERSGGWLLMERLAANAADLGVKAEFDVKVDRLVVEDGRVVGLIARRFGEELTVGARRGVVLTSGGFGANETMMEQHLPRIFCDVHRAVGTDSDDGKGIRMAQSVGAAVRHMDAVETGVWISPALLARSVLVNGAGQRFINEDTYPGRVGQATVVRQNWQALMILDDQAYNEVTVEDRMGNEPSWVCGTVAELEHEAGLPAGSLQATVDFYNFHAARGEDPLFHKNARWLRPLEPPFGAIDKRGPLLGVGYFTLGGLHTTPAGEVLDVEGAPIPGLFAAGRVASGVPASGYLSGASLGDATFFGRKAGASAAVG